WLALAPVSRRLYFPLESHATSFFSIQAATTIVWTQEPRQAMSRFLQIGELSKQTGLSIRTLRYYDEIGLLVLSHRTEADYRLYSEADIIRLQQILSLRQYDP
ncbi:MAG: MerR family transcriptional regulator, partial [Cyanobacteria bacterium J06555_12]